MTADLLLTLLVLVAVSSSLIGFIVGRLMAEPSPPAPERYEPQDQPVSYYYPPEATHSLVPRINEFGELEE